MVPVYHCPYEERVLVLLCVVGRQLETASISDFVTIDNVCCLKVLYYLYLVGRIRLRLALTGVRQFWGGMAGMIWDTKQSLDL